MRVPRSTAAFLLLSLSAGVAASSGCGARTGLYAPDLQGSGGAGGASPTVPCTPGTVTLLKADPSVMFVLDRSGSMGGGLGKNNGKQSRWSILTSALSSTLPPVDSSMEIGALLFPSGNGQFGDLSCDVSAVPALVPGKSHVSPLLDIMLTTSPGGATPTAAAIGAAAGVLAGVRAATSARAMVLATDGGPNCNDSLDPATCRCASMSMSCKGKGRMCLDDQRTVMSIDDQRLSGIPTYVIGIQDEGDDSFSDVLDAMADAGGRPKAGDQHYYAARSEAELSDALTAIRDQVGGCTYLTTSVPDAKGSITLKEGGVTVPFDPSGVEGWNWGNQSNGEILLFGSACTAAAGGTKPPVAEVMCQGS